MALDTDLMTNEFMHGFSEYTRGLRDTIFDIAAANKKFELIPEHFHGHDLRLHYQKDFIENPPSKNRFDSDVGSALKFYNILDGLVKEITGQNERYSPCFRLVQTFMELFNQPMSSFEEYLRLHKDDSDFENAFSSYLPQLEVAALSINGIMAVIEIYDSKTDGDKARIKWSKKHPEFSSGEWKPPK